MPIAFTRPVSRAMNQCELSHLARTPIDVALARQQHEHYERALRSMRVHDLEIAGGRRISRTLCSSKTSWSSSTSLAIITRPGADSRRGRARRSVGLAPSVSDTGNNHGTRDARRR